ncbi:LAQU0S01e10330g1_1 [Lachancea quebecensis]|uniref:LAQU0S01e10330g1_1 n=1 Tax=Lachancea quebecensis TaxID=1654605 RepID=A0A0P1KPF9_9SACH|nr:LAQU0S01e10330g1_1 [Lachancea quebecensis]
MKNLNLSRKLYELLTADYEDEEARLVILPDHFHEKRPADIVCVNDGNGIEIICFKTLYFQIFSEARGVLSELQIDRGCYLATTVLLLITPEDHSNIRRHEELFLSRLKDSNCDGRWKRDKVTEAFVRREIKFVTLCLTSSLARVNKSPSLWLLYRKLYVITDSLFPTIEVNHAMCFSKSAEAHFSNYYSWHTLRWMFDIGPKELKMHLSEATEAFCFRNPKDSSAWWSLSHVLVPSSDAQKHSAAQRNMLRTRYSFPSSSELIPRCASPIEVESKVRNIVKYIDYAEICEYPPFRCLEKLFQVLHQNCQEKYLERWCFQIKMFERENFAISESSVVHSNTQIQENLLIQRDFKALVMKKKFVLHMLPPTVLKSAP